MCLVSGHRIGDGRVSIADMPRPMPMERRRANPNLGSAAADTPAIAQECLGLVPARMGA
jgi:hypothetical protein